MIIGDWKDPLEGEFSKPYMQDLMNFLSQESISGVSVLPPRKNWFHAFTKTPLSKVKVVILGQDPYHGMGQAQGLSFSVPKENRIPPSLRNIFKELTDDTGDTFLHGDLSHWADQGVLLLNSVLTVEEGKAGAHAKQGWEQFTDKVITTISKKRTNVVFLLWGSYAQKKIQLIDIDKHLVLKAPHPSPLSAYRGFFGCKHFSKTNTYLKAHHRHGIRWYN